MSIFTRRHYVWLASVARDQVNRVHAATDSIVAHEAVNSAIGELAEALSTESPTNGFDKQRFLDSIFIDPTIDQMHTEDYANWRRNR